MTQELPGNATIDRTGSAAQLAAIVREWVLSGVLAPGTPIREVALAESLGVSRNTVREGVRLLLGEGLLEHRPHKGVAVATLSASDVGEIYAARRLLELTAIRVGETQGSDGLRSLQSAIQQMSEATGSSDLSGMRDADTTFHRAIVEFLGNGRLVGFEVKLLGELRLGLAYLDQGDRNYVSRWADEHRMIAQALESGDRAGAAEVLTKHLEQGEALLLAGFPGEPPSADDPN